MALFRRLFYRKPPDQLLEISDRVYVFDYCFSSEHLEEDGYKNYMNNTLVQLKGYFPDACLTVINFREGEGKNLVAEILARFNISVIEYPHGYHGCPLLPLRMVYQFLRLCDNWLSSEGQQSVLLMHCERGGWPVLSFMLASLMLYRSQYSGEERTLEMMYKQAPREPLQMFSPLNPFASHLRYLHYITGKGNGIQWPLCNVPYSLDCLILRNAPYCDGKAGFRPFVRVCGRDPSNLVDEGHRVLFTSLEKKELVHNSVQADGTKITIDVRCSIQGDVVLECICWDEDLEREETMFRIMFNTAFIQDNVLLLNSEEIDIIWGMEDQFTKNFKAEVIFSEFDVGSTTPQVVTTEQDEVETEEFFEAEEIFSNSDLHDGTRDLDIHSTPIEVHDSSLPEFVSDHKDTENISLEFDHQNLKNGLAQEILTLDDPNVLPEMETEKQLGASHGDESQRLDIENTDIIVGTHTQDSAFIEENTFITGNLRIDFKNSFSNILDDKKVICTAVSTDEAKLGLQIKLAKQNNETCDIGGQCFHDSSPDRTPKRVDLSQYTKRIPNLADDPMSLPEMNGLIHEVEGLMNTDTREVFDGGALGHATSQLEIILADQSEFSFKNEESVKVEFPEGGCVHSGNWSEFGNFNLICYKEDANDKHNFEAKEHTILASNGLEQGSQGNGQIISCDMTQKFETQLFCDERRSSGIENSYPTTGTDLNKKPIHDSQGAQTGNSEIIDWMEHKEVSRNCIKDGFVSQNSVFLELSCENKEAHVDRKKNEEQQSATSQKQSSIAPSDPVPIAQKDKLQISAGDNEKLTEPQLVIIQTSVSNDSEVNHAHLSSFPFTNSSSLPSMAPSISSMPHPSLREDPFSLSSAPTYHSLPFLSQSSHSGSLLHETPSSPPHQPHMCLKDKLPSHSHPPPPPQPPHHPPPMHSRDSPKRKHSPPLPPPQSSPSTSLSPPPPPPLPPVQSIHPRLSSTVARSNCSGSHLSLLPYREACQAPPPPLVTPLSKKQSASELLASYLPPLPPIKVNSPTKSLSTTFTNSSFTVWKFDFALFASHLAFLPFMEFQNSTKVPMSKCPSSSPLHHVKKSKTSNFFSAEISTPSYASTFHEGSPSPSGGTSPTIPRTFNPCQILGENTPQPPLPPPLIGFPSAPVTERCKGAPSLPPHPLGGYGQGSTPSSLGQTISSRLAPPLPYKGPVVAPPSPPSPLSVSPPPLLSPQVPTPIFRGASQLPSLPGGLVGGPLPYPLPNFEGIPTPSRIHGMPRGPPLPPPPPPPTSGGAPTPALTPPPEGHRVAPTPSSLPGGLGEAPPLLPSPREFGGPPSLTPPFAFGSSGISLEPRYHGGHEGAPPPPLPPSGYHDRDPPTSSTTKGGVPPPPMLPRTPGVPPPPPSSGLRGPPPPLGPMTGGKGLGFARAGVPSTAIKKSILKPLHWVKVTRATQGSLWAELQKYADAQSTTEFDISELETLFSSVVKKPDGSKSEGHKSITKSDKVHLVVDVRSEAVTIKVLAVA
ncbi:formin-like protein 20 [Dendrobium catenatum]|uniref:formin-like protein 20 n=1 Tax=Dendrobium catenatum TaxID=906689 RepID=UPI0009F427FF|nr:formin-like protein 20 [Dendrobium catenatum]